MRTTDMLTPPNALQQTTMPPAHPHGQADEAPPTVPLQQQWIPICAVDDIPRLGARIVKQPSGSNVAVFRTADDKLFALADRCPHRGGPLSQGIVFGDRVACPLHNTCVDLESGCAVAPDTGQVDRYPVKLEAGTVFVQMAVPGGTAG